KELAFIEDRQNLKVLNLATRKVRALAGPESLMSKNDGDQRFRWSPNGQWIVFNLAPTGKFQTQLGLVRADGQDGVVDLTRSGFDCMNPVWVLGGKALLYSTTRDGMRGLAAIGGSQTDWYAMFLDRVAWDRSRLSKAELTLQKEAEGKGPTPVATPEPLDLEPRWDRTTRLTLQSARMGDAVLSADGETLYYLARFERGLNLWSTQVRTKETRMLTPLDASAATLTWDREQKTLLLLADGMIAKVDPGTGRKDPIPVSCELWLNPAAERMAMFEHATRRITETFYDRSFRGLDWQGLCKAYAKHVPHTGSSFELAELLSELLGELNVSHSGGYLRAKEGDVDLTASLGFLADETHQGSGIRVAEVLRNGPLDKADLTAGPGTVIEAIDGEAIPADRDWVGLLNRKAGKRVLVQLKNGEQRSEAVVRPIPVAEETLLLYERWVRRNRDEVERLSGGKLGYVHVRNGFDRPFRNIIEEVIGHRDGRVGVIVDTRFNPGGALTSDLITFLTGRRMFHSDAAGRNVGWEPGARWTGASVLLTNEGAYSDGHCLSCAFQSQGVGKIVGMPVPGTCIWSISELLQDETIICGAPTVGMKDTSGRLLEGIQVEPDVRVPNPYGEVAAGRDAQLAAAVQVLLAETSVSGKGR
ncbi:MAG: S41 family peptidase, partial [Geothrix sp.]